MLSNLLLLVCLYCLGTGLAAILFAGAMWRRWSHISFSWLTGLAVLASSMRSKHAHFPHPVHSLRQNLCVPLSQPAQHAPLACASSIACVHAPFCRHYSVLTDPRSFPTDWGCMHVSPPSLCGNENGVSSASRFCSENSSLHWPAVTPTFSTTWWYVYIGKPHTVYILITLSLLQGMLRSTFIMASELWTDT